MRNQFYGAAHSRDTHTEKGALAHSTTGTDLVDQFATAATQRGRDVHAVWADQYALHLEDPLNALKFVFYLRLITRKPSGSVKTENVQRGQGVRDEAHKRYLWYLKNEPDIFFNNLYLYISAIGSFRDFWELLHLAVQNGIPVDDRAFVVYDVALLDESARGNALKYLPLVRSKKRTKTDRARNRSVLAALYAKHLGITARELRLLKSGGDGHEWQQCISRRHFDQIDFDSIPGRALSRIAKGKFLDNQGMTDTYLTWLAAKPVAKFTGYVHELAHILMPYRGEWLRERIPPRIRLTVDKQFAGLLETARESGKGALAGNILPVLDSSRSMNIKTAGGSVSAITVAASLTVFFSMLNEGHFHRMAVKFAPASELIKIKGNGFCEMYLNALGAGGIGTTNFQSVIDLIVRVRRQNPDLPLNEYPTTILVVSDLQFDPVFTGSGAQYYRAGGDVDSRAIETNWDALRRKLGEYFPQEWVDDFRAIWWQVANRRSAHVHQTTLSDSGAYYVSGFDGSVVSLLLGGEAAAAQKEAGRQLTAEELVDVALSQEILTHVHVRV